MTDKYSISCFQDVVKPWEINRLFLSKEKLFDVLTRARKPKNKKKMPCWSPCIFSNGYANNANSIEVSCLVWDLDTGKITFDEMRERFESLPYNVIMHTSYSHSKSKHKYRVILPLLSPVVADEWEFAWIGSLLYFSKRAKPFTKRLDIDRTCKDPRRLYFLGGYSKQDYRCWSQLNLRDWDPHPIKEEVAEREYQNRKKKREKQQRELREFLTIQDRKRGLHRDFHNERRQKLRLDSSERLHFARLMSSFGGILKADRCVSWSCPQCKRTDATYFYIDPSVLSYAYCNHKKSCGFSSSLYGLAEIFGIGGY